MLITDAVYQIHLSSWATAYFALGVDGTVFGYTKRLFISVADAIHHKCFLRSVMIFYALVVLRCRWCHVLVSASSQKCQHCKSGFSSCAVYPLSWFFGRFPPRKGVQ